MSKFLDPGALGFAIDKVFLFLETAKALAPDTV